MLLKQLVKKHLFDFILAVDAKKRVPVNVLNWRTVYGALAAILSAHLVSQYSKDLLLHFEKLTWLQEFIARLFGNAEHFTVASTPILKYFYMLQDQSEFSYSFDAGRKALDMQYIIDMDLADPDSDNDGLSDDKEANVESIYIVDFDIDNISDYIGVTQLGTDPTNKDTDKDSWQDDVDLNPTQFDGASDATHLVLKDANGNEINPVDIYEYGANRQKVGNGILLSQSIEATIDVATKVEFNEFHSVASATSGDRDWYQFTLEDTSKLTLEGGAGETLQIDFFQFDARNQTYTQLTNFAQVSAAQDDRGAFSRNTYELPLSVDDYRFTTDPSDLDSFFTSYSIERDDSDFYKLADEYGQALQPDSVNLDYDDDGLDFVTQNELGDILSIHETIYDLNGNEHTTYA